MITVFNRKELVITYSMELQAQVRSILSANHIDYTVATSGNAVRNIGGGPIAADRMGENPTASVEYRVFVKKSDYETAAGLVQGLNA